jgi:hypothetical protein
LQVNIGCSINVKLLGSRLPNAILLYDTIAYRRRFGLVNEA